MHDQTKTGINLDITREFKGYHPSIADALMDGSYNLSELNLSFEEACQKLAALRKNKDRNKGDEDSANESKKSKS